MLGVEELLVSYLQPLFPSARVATDIPAQLADLLPVIQVKRVGGNRTFSLDKPTVDIDVFHTSRLAATDLASQVDDVLTYTLPTRVLGHVLGLQGTYAGPAWRNYDNPYAWRVGAAYGLLVHIA